MLNALRVDFRRFLMTKSFMVLMLWATVVQPLCTELLIWGFAKLYHENITVTLTNLQSYTSMASIYLAVMVTIFLSVEAGEGIIRNKLISGKKRHHILISYSIVNATVALFLQVFSVLIPLSVGVLVGAQCQVLLPDIIRFTAISSLSGMAIGVFYTAIYIAICDIKISIAVPGIVAVVMYIILLFVLDTLYTDSGVPKVSGMTLKIYESIDRFVPFAHLNGPLRWDNASYIISDVVLIGISLLIGALVFAKKDMK